MNFRNSNPPASFKISRISSLKDSNDANIELGSNLVDEADILLRNATDSFDSLATASDTVMSYSSDLEDEQEDMASKLQEVYNTVFEAEAHTSDLERQVRRSGR